MTGDVAWGGNWFFLTEAAPCAIEAANIPALTEAAQRIKRALVRDGVHRPRTAARSTISSSSAPRRPAPTSRNFVLCPGGAYDRSPCGTGTSAKLACLAAQGALAPGAAWVQESVIGTRFVAPLRMRARTAPFIPSITGRAWVTAEATLLRDPTDPFPNGIGGVTDQSLRAA